MNRRNLLKGAITVGLVASIIKGRVEPEPTMLLAADPNGATKLYFDGKPYMYTTEDGLVVMKARQQGKAHLHRQILDNFYLQSRPGR